MKSARILLLTAITSLSMGCAVEAGEDESPLAQAHLFGLGAAQDEGRVGASAKHECEADRSDTSENVDCDLPFLEADDRRVVAALGERIPTPRAGNKRGTR